MDTNVESSSPSVPSSATETRVMELDAAEETRGNAIAKTKANEIITYLFFRINMNILLIHLAKSRKNPVSTAKGKYILYQVL
jgi:hypothetical protein